MTQCGEAVRQAAMSAERTWYLTDRDNTASIRLLEKTGFVREGYAREYLCINGIWQDHLLYARLETAAKS